MGQVPLLASGIRCPCSLLMGSLLLLTFLLILVVFLLLTFLMLLSFLLLRVVVLTVACCCRHCCCLRPCCYWHSCCCWGYLLICCWADAAVGECGAHHRQALAGHLHRAHLHITIILYSRIVQFHLFGILWMRFIAEWLEQGRRH